MNLPIMIMGVSVKLQSFTEEEIEEEKDQLAEAKIIVDFRSLE